MCCKRIKQMGHCCFNSSTLLHGFSHTWNSSQQNSEPTETKLRAIHGLCKLATFCHFPSHLAFIDKKTQRKYRNMPNFSRISICAHLTTSLYRLIKHRSARNSHALFHKGHRRCWP